MCCISHASLHLNCFCIQDHFYQSENVKLMQVSKLSVVSLTKIEIKYEINTAWCEQFQSLFVDLLEALGTFIVLQLLSNVLLFIYLL